MSRPLQMQPRLLQPLQNCPSLWQSPNCHPSIQTLPTNQGRATSQQVTHCAHPRISQSLRQIQLESEAPGIRSSTSAWQAASHSRAI